MSALRGVLVFSVLCACAWPRRTEAQEAFLVFAGKTGDDTAEASRFAREILAKRGIEPLEISSFAPAGQVVPEARLAVLVEVEHALRDARAKAAALDERAALETLLSAERALLSSLEIPGVHAWLSEVWVAMAVIAAQRNELDLARTLLSRAATLDPQRHLLAAEAAPAVVELAQEIARVRDAAARGRFYVETSPSDALVWIDGEVVDPTRELALSRGTHLLQVRALGHLPYAALIDVLSGSRAPVAVRLSAHPVLTLLEEVTENSDRSRVEALSRKLADRSGTPVWVFAHGAHGRLLGSRCLPDACEPELFFVPADGSFVKVAKASDPARWLDGKGGARAQAKTQAEGRKLWPWITAASVALVTAAISVSLATRDPAVREERTLVVDPGTVR